MQINNMYKELKKIVNEINYPIEDENFKKLVKRLEKENCVYQPHTKEIHLEDILLALNKLNWVDVKFGKVNEKSLIVTKTYGKGDMFAIKLSKPLSQQKEEVYNKLIKILR